MINYQKLILTFLILFFSFSPIFGQGPSSEYIDEIIKNQIKILEKWGKDPVIVRAVKEQNAKKIPLTQIQATDKTWCANSGIDDFMKSLMSNACANRLKALTNKSNLYLETFVMDSQGAIVGMTSKTSDYWQGDEPKWKRAYNDGKGSVFVDKSQYDTSAKAILVQISVPVRESDGMAIGAITIGVNISRPSAGSKTGTR
jgi:hypothetical protein